MPRGNGPFSICGICHSGANKSVNESKRRGNSGFDIQGRFDMVLVGEEGIVGYRRRMRCNKREDKLERKAEKKKRASTVGATANVTCGETQPSHVAVPRVAVAAATPTSQNIPLHPTTLTSIRSRPVIMLLDEDPATVSDSFFS